LLPQALRGRAGRAPRKRRSRYAAPPLRCPPGGDLRLGTALRRSCTTSDIEFAQQLHRRGVRRQRALAQLLEQSRELAVAMAGEPVAQDALPGGQQPALGDGCAARVDLAAAL